MESNQEKIFTDTELPPKADTRQLEGMVVLHLFYLDSEKDPMRKTA